MENYETSATGLVAVEVQDQFGRSFPGTAETLRRTPREAFFWAGRRSFKLVGFGLLAMLPFGFIEPFMFMVWGSLAIVLLFLVVGPFLHIHLAGETRSFTEIRAACPLCQSPGPLKPYLSTRFAEKFTVLCPACGQTSQVVAPTPSA